MRPEETYPPDHPLAWIQDAKEDLEYAGQQPSPGISFRVVCFHAQQATEKALKALLIAHGIEPPHTHDLTSLMEDLKARGEQSPLDDATLDELRFFAGAGRYPGMMEPAGRRE